jgi:hypothetical protein
LQLGLLGLQLHLRLHLHELNIAAKSGFLSRFFSTLLFSCLTSREGKRLDCVFSS